ncbi:MAG: hypothetical protein J1E80_10030 [Desulfovibrionaceae bacterium]|nr:hypothetical protein [Desulfovibrionaceae bacterium]
MLEYHGIDAARWDVMRKMVKEGPDGKRYFFPDEAARLTDADLAPLLPESLRRASAVAEPARFTDASAVATQEATDEDSNGVLRALYKEIAVAIPKPRGLGKGWREDSNWSRNTRREEPAVAIRKPGEPGNGCPL